MATSAGSSDWRAKCRKQSLQCVEQLLEEDITSSQLIQAAEILSRAEYDDVVDERTIVGLCGYPLCPHKLGPMPTQRYRINVKRKEILDITERKKYCSDECYKSSQYFGHQLSPEPLWTRPPPLTPEKTVVKLLRHKRDTNNTSAGTAHQNTSMEQSLTEEILSFKPDTSYALTDNGDVPNIHTDSKCVSNDQDASDREAGIASADKETPAKATDSFTKISRAFSTWTSRSVRPDGPSATCIGPAVPDATKAATVFLPAVHSIHGDQLQWSIFRRQVVVSLPKVCATLKVGLSEAQESLTNLASHFHLDRHSIMFRPSEWRVILLLLLIRCGMVGESVILENPVVSEWLQTVHMTHSNLQQLLTLATIDLT